MTTQKPVDVQEFIKSSGAANVLQTLQQKLAGEEFIISDVYDAEGNQYVDLVQEGGGVWGVALLGYTYILEKMGIRFFSLAGTSAGAINTMLMAATKNKNEEKTEQIIGDLLQLDMFSFVDGKKNNWVITKVIKRVIQRFIVHPRYTRRLAISFIIILAVLALLSLGSFTTIVLAITPFVKFFAIAALITWIIVILTVALIISRLKFIARSGYGLNEGNVFYNWINGILLSTNIRNLEDLKTRFCNIPPNLKVRRDEMRDATVVGEITPPSSPMLIIVASDITTGNKIEFPRMWDMFWKTTRDVDPASFVRASMSIPIFFETYRIPVTIPTRNAVEIWKNHINWNGDIPDHVEMVDGGVLSNFPINVFYNAKYIIPRMPTFGIRLGGSGIQAAKEINSVSAYFSSLISTLRGTTDKEFINKNKAFELGVKEVDLSNYSWLNFFMSDDDKKAIFLKGAQAAALFLEHFDWADYKRQRFNNSEVLVEQLKNPNNW
jgi:NTE family protein